jgi:hypothetical protein
MWTKILEYLKKGFLIIVIVTFAALVISLIGRVRISRVILVFSTIGMVVGSGAMLGNLGNISGAPHKRSNDVIEDTVPDESKKGKRKAENMKLSLFIGIMGFLIMVLGFIFDAFGM